MEVISGAVAGLKSVYRLFTADLNALPAEAFDQSFGPKTRTVADITFEVTLVNDHIGMVVRNEPAFEWPDGSWIVAPDHLRTKEAVMAHFDQSFLRTIETFEALDESDFATTVETEHGPSTRLERCRFIAAHTWYHSGQLNFIQTLLGDDGWHW